MTKDFQHMLRDADIQFLEFAARDYVTRCAGNVFCAGDGAIIAASDVPNVITALRRTAAMQRALEHFLRSEEAKR